MASFFDSITSEQREEYLAKAREARAAKAAYKEATKHLLKQNYLDKGHWAALASEYGVRMPSNDEAVDVSCIRKYLKKCGIEVEVWNQHYTSMKYFVQNNPTWTKYAVAGLILEMKEDLEKKP